MADTPDRIRRAVDHAAAEAVVEEFRQEWGFDPMPFIEQAILDGNYDLEGGTDDERAFLREVLSDAPLKGLPGKTLAETEAELRRKLLGEPAEGGTDD